MSGALVAGLCAAVALLLRGTPRTAVPPAGVTGAVGGGVEPVPGDSGTVGRGRVLVCVAAGAGGLVWFDGGLAWVAAGVLGGGSWLVLTRSEPPQRRRVRLQAERELPHVVLLLGLVLETGASVGEALDRVVSALPGPASAGLTVVRRRLAVGVPPAEAWAALDRQPGLEPLGRALARAERSGAPVARRVRQLAEELAAERRAAVEDRARAVGVRAALPLGLCLLPSFLLLGIVPVVVTTLGALTW